MAPNHGLIVRSDARASRLERWSSSRRHGRLLEYPSRPVRGASGSGRWKEAYGKDQALNIAWAPTRYGGTGPCFAISETSEMLQMISRLRNRLAFAVLSRRCWSTMFRTPFRPGMSSSDGVLTPVAPGSSLLVRRSHGYLRLSAALAAGAVAVTSPSRCLFMTTQ